MPTWVAIYLLGCVSTAALIALHFVLAVLVRWLDGGPIYWRNMRKVGLYWNYVLGRWESGRPSPAEGFLLCFFEVLLSWINVFPKAFALVRMVLAVTKSRFERVPEKIIELRFPLKRNANLSPEAVWARLVSIDVVSGGPCPTLVRIKEGLSEMAAVVPQFNEALAIEEIQRLGVVDYMGISKKRSEENKPQAS